MRQLLRLCLTWTLMFIIDVIDDERKSYVEKRARKVSETKWFGGKGSKNGILGAARTVDYYVWRLILEDGTVLFCADDHLVYKASGEQTLAKDVEVGDRLKTETGSAVVSDSSQMPFYMKMYDMFMTGDHRYHANGIESHNSTVTGAVALWMVVFRTSYTVAILANKLAVAREILSRVQDMFIELPIWMQPGVTDWSKTSFKLENKSVCFASATSPSAIRGFSINCARGDTTSVTVRIDGDTIDTTLEDLELIEEELGVTSKREILTDSGFEPYSHVEFMKLDETIVVDTSLGRIECTGDHDFFDDSLNKVKASDLSKGTILAGGIIVESINKGSVHKVYDVINAGKNNRFLANGILISNCLIIDEAAFIPQSEDFFTAIMPTISSSKKSKLILISTPNGFNKFSDFYHAAKAGINGFGHFKFTWKDHPDRDKNWEEVERAKIGSRKFGQEYECLFIGSGGTLLEPEALSSLESRLPLILSGDEKFAIWEKPKKGHLYVGIVDTGEGLGQDSSVVSVFDCTNGLNVLVARYKDNEISPEELPKIASEIGKLYDDALLVVESNSIGRAVAYALWNDIGYANLLNSKIMDGESALIGNKMKIGLRTTSLTKQVGCRRLKYLMELPGDDPGRLVCYDSLAINEMNTFIANGSGSYAAEPGKHDDIAMTMVIYAYLTTTPYFESYRYNPDIDIDIEVAREALATIPHMSTVDSIKDMLVVEDED